jgi:predicted DNA-binding protein (MmcQ/YjbR family)
MNLEMLEKILAEKPAVTKEIPFGPETLVYKVKGKIFAMIAWDEDPLRFNLKCEPQQAVQLREQYPRSVLPGYYMNKKHWNTIVLDGSLPEALILEMIENSYRLVVQSLKKSDRDSLGV